MEFTVRVFCEISSCRSSLSSSYSQADRCYVRILRRIVTSFTFESQNELVERFSIFFRILLNSYYDSEEDLIYEHLLELFSLKFRPQIWTLLPQAHGGVTFVRRGREESSRILILRESLSKYIKEGKGRIKDFLAFFDLSR